jgi:hypothetical protein
MAHRKHKKGQHRRRKVGAMSLHHSSPLVVLGSMGLGYFLGDTVNSMIDSVIPSSIFPAAATTTPAATGIASLGLNENTAALVLEGGVGTMLLVAKTGRSVVKSAAGGFLVGLAGHRLLKTMGVVTGYQSVPVIGNRRVAGYQSVPVIGGTPQVLQGTPAVLQGYKVSGYGSQGSGVMGKVGRVKMGNMYSGYGVTGTDNSKSKAKYYPMNGGSGSGITPDSCGSDMMN